MAVFMYMARIMVAGAHQPQNEAPPPSGPGVFDLFHDEIAQVKAMAIGYVMGLARDALKESAPQLAAKIDDVMNSVTTKLGGEPVQQDLPSWRRPGHA